MLSKESFVLSGLALGLAACATAPAEAEPDPERPVRMPEQQCDDTLVQDRVGKRFEAEMVEEFKRLTGAVIVRIAPPNTAVTMDYRLDRLTVSFDEDMIIERISCG